jgi:hypothetical protein
MRRLTSVAQTPATTAAGSGVPLGSLPDLAAKTLLTRHSAGELRTEEVDASASSVHTLWPELISKSQSDREHKSGVLVRIENIAGKAHFLEGEAREHAALDLAISFV